MSVPSLRPLVRARDPREHRPRRRDLLQQQPMILSPCPFLCLCPCPFPFPAARMPRPSRSRFGCRCF